MAASMHNNFQTITMFVFSDTFKNIINVCELGKSLNG